MCAIVEGLEKSVFGCSFHVGFSAQVQFSFLKLVGERLFWLKDSWRTVTEKSSRHHRPGTSLHEGGGAP